MGLLDKISGYKKKAENWNEQRILNSNTARDKSIERRRSELAIRSQEVALSEKEARLNKRAVRASGYKPMSYNNNGGSDLFDMGGGSGNAFSFDMGGGGLFDSGMGPRRKHKKANKKAKNDKGKDIHIHIHK